MFNKIKDTLFENSLDIEKLLKGTDLTSIPAKTLEAFRQAIKATDDQTKSEISGWFSKIESIKKDTTLTKKEKEEKISALNSSEVVLSFVKSLLHVAASSVPIDNKDALKTGVNTAVTAATFISFRYSAVLLIALRMGLPKFAMTEHFDKCAAFALKELGIQSNAS